ASVGRKMLHWCACKFRDRLTAAKIVENGITRRVHFQPEDDYKATYGPLISLVSEKCTNDNAIDVALGRRMEEHRFVIALTFEQVSKQGARHLGAMVMYEASLLNLPAECPRVEKEEHKPRFRTLQTIARQYARNPERFGIVNVWRPKVGADVATLP